MQAVAIVIVVWIYMVSIMGFLQIFNVPPFNIGYSSLILSLVLSLIGISLGFLFYGLSLLKATIKKYMVFGITISILLPILVIYFGLGTNALIELLVFIVKIGFFLMMCSVPLIGVYALLKQQRNAFLVSGGGVLFFYFFALIISKKISIFSVPFYSTDQIAQLLLFFISVILYLELGTTSMYFDSVISKMAPNEDSDEFMLARFNTVFNRYVILVPILFVIFYFISLVFFWMSNSFSAEEFMGVNLTSAAGIFLLVIITIAGAILFWLLIPSEKPEKD